MTFIEMHSDVLMATFLSVWTHRAVSVSSKTVKVLDKHYPEMSSVYGPEVTLALWDRD